MRRADEIRRYLGVLFNDAPTDALVEVRYRVSHGMRQVFQTTADLDAAARTILAKGCTTDVFVGVVPRSRRGGSRADLMPSTQLVWVDCDDELSAVALDRIQPPPSLVVASGTGRNRHGYWPLSEPINLDIAESINRGLALALGADQGSTDAPRILRPAGSFNHKDHSPSPVRIIRAEPRLLTCPGAFREMHGRQPHPRSDGSATSVAADPLRQISPQVYVSRLTGRQVDRSGKIRCPFHTDTTPSLHVYHDPARGWYCYGCGHGGSIYDFASLLWGHPSRGPDFPALRRRLLKALTRS
jgi:CHC2 zinc finger